MMYRVKPLFILLTLSVILLYQNCAKKESFEALSSQPVPLIRSDDSSEQNSEDLSSCQIDTGPTDKGAVYMGDIARWKLNFSSGANLPSDFKVQWNIKPNSSQLSQKILNSVASMKARTGRIQDISFDDAELVGNWTFSALVVDANEKTVCTAQEKTISFAKVCPISIYESVKTNEARVNFDASSISGTNISSISWIWLDSNGRRASVQVSELVKNNRYQFTFTKAGNYKAVASALGLAGNILCRSNALSLSSTAAANSGSVQEISVQPPPANSPADGNSENFEKRFCKVKVSVAADSEPSANFVSGKMNSKLEYSIELDNQLLGNRSCQLRFSYATAPVLPQWIIDTYTPVYMSVESGKKETFKIKLSNNTAKLSDGAPALPNANVNLTCPSETQLTEDKNCKGIGVEDYGAWDKRSGYDNRYINRNYQQVVRECSCQQEVLVRTNN